MLSLLLCLTPAQMPHSDLVIGGLPTQPINLKLKETVAFGLRANPSTGYAWKVVKDGAPGMKFLGFSSPSSLPGRHMPGQGGDMFARFRTVKKGHYEITLRYERSWEKKKSAPQVVKVNVK